MAIIPLVSRLSTKLNDMDLTDDLWECFKTYRECRELCLKYIQAIIHTVTTLIAEQKKSLLHASATLPPEIHSDSDGS
jgi:hypothetical protein